MPRRLTIEDRIKELAREDKAASSRNYNFRVHGKRLEYAPRSLFLFKDTNPIRRGAVWLVESKPFEVFILAVILLNSVLLALSDYTQADSANQLLDIGWRNHAVIKSEVFFTVVFTLEAVLKIVSMGFAMSKGSYLRDPWNALDFTVVLAAVLSAVPNMPNISILRTVRILRPLRSLTAIPGMRLLVTALLNSLPALLNVVFLMMFLFTVFGILGVQLLAGQQHARCRLTQWPVRFTGSNGTGVCSVPYSDACVDAIYKDNTARQVGNAKVVYVPSLQMNVSYLMETTGLERCMAGNNEAGTSKSTSVWATPRDCFWPIDVTDTYYCSNSGSGDHTCGKGRWCASNYDAYGNPMFKNNLVQLSDSYIPSLNFGYTTFDSIFRAFVTIFQSITQEGWTDIMYQIMDVYSPVFGSMFMVLLVLYGSFFNLNLIITVIWSSFEESQEQEKAKKEYLFRKRFNVDGDDPLAADSHVGMAVLSALGMPLKVMKNVRNVGSSIGLMSRMATSRKLGGAGSAVDVTARSGANGTPDDIAAVDGDTALVLPPPLITDSEGAAQDSDDCEPNLTAAAAGAGGSDESPVLAAAASSLIDSEQFEEQDGLVPHNPFAVQSSLITTVQVSPPGTARTHHSHASHRSILVARHGDGSSMSVSSQARHIPAVPGLFNAPLFGAKKPHGDEDEFDVNQLTRADIAERVLARSRLSFVHRDEVDSDLANDITSPAARHGATASVSSDSRDALHHTLRRHGSNTSANGMPPESARRLSVTVPMLLLHSNSVRDGIAEEGSGADQSSGSTSEEVSDVDGVVNQTAIPAVSSDKIAAPEGTLSGSLRKLKFKVDLPPLMQRVRQKAHNIVTSSWFSGLVAVLIIVNTIVLSMDRYPISADDSETLEIINFVVTSLFFLDMSLKIIGMGFREYGADRMNVFDATIVLVSVVELVALPPSFLTPANDAPKSGGLSALRTFRLFRVFRFARNWTSLRVLLQILAKTVKDIGNFALLLLLLIYIFALLGMQMFQNRLCFDSVTDLQIPHQNFAACRPRSNFEGLPYAIMTVFQVMTAENWNAVMYDGWRALTWPGTLYCISLIILGNFIALNLFIAILLSNFEGVDELMNAEKKSVLPLVSVSKLFVIPHAVSAWGSRFTSGSSWFRRSRGTAPVVPQSPENKSGDHIRKLADSIHVGSALSMPGPGRKAFGRFAKLKSGSEAPLEVVAEAHEEAMETGDAAGLGQMTVDVDGEITSDDLLPMRINGKGLVMLDDTVSPVTGETVTLHEDRPSTAMHLATRRPTANVLPGSIASPDDTGRAESRASTSMDTKPLPSIGVKQPATALSIDLASGRDGLSTAASEHDASRFGQKVVPVVPQDTKLSKESLQQRRSLDTNSDNISSNPSSFAGKFSTRRTLQVDPSSKQSVQIVGNSLCMFRETNVLRLMCARLISSKYFDNFILLTILTSSVLLAVDNPLNDPDLSIEKFIRACDTVFTVIFSVELGIRVVAMGFLFGKTSYCRSGWNVLDMIIVIISILSQSGGGGSSLQSLRTLRALRAFRPLRVISRHPGMRLVVSALFSSIPAILNVMFVALLFFLIFGIVAVQYFKGALSACTAADGSLPIGDDVASVLMNPTAFGALTGSAATFFNTTSYATYAGVPTGKAVCGFIAQALPDAGIDWTPTTPFSFNNILSAMSTLFQISTTEGWVDLTYACVDSRGMDMQPKRDHNVAWVFFFIAFIIMGSFFVMNLFIGVIIENFNAMKKKLGSNALLTERQEEWVKTRRMMMRMRPLRKRVIPTNIVRKTVYRLVNSKRFEGFIMLCIIVNTVLLAMPYFGASDQYLNILENLNVFFVVVFTSEATLKMVAHAARYWIDPWNVFDFAVVLGSLLGIIIQSLTGVKAGPIVSVIRTFRVGRVFRLIKRARALNVLFQTLLVTLPSIGNISALLFLLLFIYSVMGVQLFAPVMWQTNLNAHANYQSFGRAMLTLFRATTGEAWDYIMADLGTVDPLCDADLMSKPWSYKQQFCGFSSDEDCLPVPGCGNPVAATVFYESFTLLVSYIFMNLFVAVILEGFNEAEDEQEAILSKEHLQQFQLVWVEFDPDGVGIVSRDHLNQLLRQLPYPMGYKDRPLGAPPTLKELRDRLGRMDVKLYQHKFVTFWDFGAGLARIAFEEEARHHGEIFELPKSTARSPKTRFMKKLTTQAGDDAYSLQCYFAANAIQTIYLNYRRNKQRKAGIKVQRRGAVVQDGGSSRALMDTLKRGLSGDKGSSRNLGDSAGSGGLPSVTVPSMLKSAAKSSKDFFKSMKRGLVPSAPVVAEGDVCDAADSVQPITSKVQPEQSPTRRKA